jgi:hypothetical protein
MMDCRAPPSLELRRASKPGNDEKRIMDCRIKSGNDEGPLSEEDVACDACPPYSFETEH